VKVALLADVHANLVALEAVLAALPGVEEIWVMGDTVGYGPEPSDVLALLRERGAHLVAGNHDLAVGTGLGLELFNGAAAAAARAHREWLSAEERDALAALPTVLERDEATLVHGSLRDPVWEYVFDNVTALATLQLQKKAICCNGHTHVPAIYGLTAGHTSPGGPRYSGGVTGTRGQPALDVAHALHDRALVNPGSVGQPRDGDPRAAWAVLDTGERAVTFGRTPYDVARTQERMRARKLPDFLVERLALGL
jgi:diadenosine tetraphosphatase ApaH/serine/threonine PP2A family protein phosphatase